MMMEKFSSQQESLDHTYLQDDLLIEFSFYSPLLLGLVNPLDERIHRRSTPEKVLNHLAASVAAARFQDGFAKLHSQLRVEKIAAGLKCTEKIACDNFAPQIGVITAIVTSDLISG